jgi:hypothetical protein
MDERAMAEAPQAVRAALAAAWEIVDVMELLSMRRLPADETKTAADRLEHATMALLAFEDSPRGFVCRGERSP